MTGNKGFNQYISKCISEQYMLERNHAATLHSFYTVIVTFIPNTILIFFPIKQNNGLLVGMSSDRIRQTAMGLNGTATHTQFPIQPPKTLTGNTNQQRNRGALRTTSGWV